MYKRQGFLSEERERGFAGLGYLPMTHNIDKRAACRCHEPRLWALGHAVSRPSFECHYECIADGILRAPHVVRVLSLIHIFTALRLLSLRMVNGRSEATT